MTRTQVGPILASVNVGRVETRSDDRPWRSAIWKVPTAGPVALGTLGLAGDQQGNRRVHGGPDKAVCVYSADHTAWWRVTLGAPDWGAGAVGENFTVSGQTELTVCLGDIIEVGTALVQVSQPRSPCRTLARRWQRPDLPKRVVQSGFTGWYLRVLRDGQVEAGATLSLVERPHEQWPIARVNRVSYGLQPEAEAAADPGALAALAAVPALAGAWRDGILGV